MPKEYDIAEAKWEAAKSKNAEILDALKQLNADFYQGNITLDEFARGQPALMEAYNQINKEKNELYEIAIKIQSEAQVLRFRSTHFLLGELGWAVGLLLYALVNVFHIFYIRTRLLRREFAGKLLLHGTLLFIGCFYTFYVFYSKDDFAQHWYILAMIFCTASLAIAGKLMADSYMKRAIAVNKKTAAEVEAQRRIAAEIEERIYARLQEIVSERRKG